VIDSLFGVAAWVAKTATLGDGFEEMAQIDFCRRIF
jgi:hypothetical protein